MIRPEIKTKKTGFFILMAMAYLFMAPSLVFPLDWVLYGKPDTGFFLAYYDRGKIVLTDEGTLRVTVKYVYTASGKKEVITSRERSGLPTGGYETLDHSIVQYELNCKTKEQAIFTVSEVGAKGKELDRYNTPVKAWTPIKPGGIGDELLSKVCK